MTRKGDNFNLFEIFVIDGHGYYVNGISVDGSVTLVRYA